MLMATKGPLRRLPYSCSARATSSLPVPELAGDHHRQVRLREPGEHAVDLLHRRAAADQRQAFTQLGGKPLGFAPRLGKRAADHGDQLVQVERLRQIFVGAPFCRGDRGHERVLRAHDDDRQVRPEFLYARDEVEGALVRHQHIGDDEVPLALADPAPQRRRVAGGAWCIAGTRQGLVQHRADRSVVVGDENIAFGHCRHAGRRARGKPEHGQDLLREQPGRPVHPGRHPGLPLRPTVL